MLFSLSVFNYFTVSLFLGGIVALFAGLIAFLSNPHSSANRAWLLLNVSAAIWSFGYFAMAVASSKELAQASNWILHAAASLIPIFYLLFVLTFTRTVRKNIIPLLIASCVAVFFLIMSGSAQLVQDVFSKFIFSYAPDAGPLYGYFTAYFFIVVGYSITVLYYVWRKAEPERARRILYILFSSLAGFIGGGSVFFLTFNINLPPYPLPFFAFYPVIITYAMLRHRLFNVKIIVTELLTFALWFFLIFQAFLSKSLSEQILNIIILAAVITVGVFLIRSVIHEVEQRERIEELADELAEANEHLKALDQRKSEFISLASHQLRTPLTAIKGYASMILEGSFGKYPKKMQQPLERIYKSSDRLVDIIQDYLTISRIEQDRIEYQFHDADLRDIVETAIEEERPDAEEKGLALNLLLENENGFSITADREKLIQVIGNIIDNSIKYTEEGGVTVTLSRVDNEHMYRIIIEDTGIGMTEESQEKLFQKFTRGEGGTKANTGGSGLGLYIAKRIVEAHHGSIWAESEGEGEGSTFYIELPMQR